MQLVCIEVADEEEKAADEHSATHVVHQGTFVLPALREGQRIARTHQHPVVRATTNNKEIRESSKYKRVWICGGQVLRKGEVAIQMGGQERRRARGGKAAERDEKMHDRKEG